MGKNMTKDDKIIIFEFAINYASKSYLKRPIQLKYKKRSFLLSIKVNRRSTFAKHNISFFYLHIGLLFLIVLQ